MSPRTKKILMIAAAAVGGYIIYAKVIKKPSSSKATLIGTKVATMNLQSIGTLKTAAYSAGVSKIMASTGTKATALGVEEALGIEEALGVTESLGSLGSRRR